ncbi:hematopoietically expressed homeobox [Arctopsyche grandis]|uniref:hematopoietically expressed homeobox n=1 Tax=Arctopsyche grandis TaxID=121162 RepID=UPI00406DA1D4
MTSKSATKPSSFFINDILDMKNNNKKNDSFDERTERPSADINNNNSEKDDRLKSTLNVQESSVFRPCPRSTNPNAYRSGMLPRYEDYRKSVENFYHKNAYHSVNKYNPLNRSAVAYPSGYGSYMGVGRLHLASASPYLDPYGSPYSNAVDSHSQWGMLPGMIGGYGLNGYHPLGYSPYLRPLPLSSLAKRKGGQVRFTPQQTRNLESRFNAHKYLSPEDRRLLAVQLKLSDRQVKTWFQNRRAKWRRANNITTNDDAESDNQSDEEITSKDENVYRSKKSPILV